MLDVRVRNKVSGAELESKWGKIVTDDDYNLLVTGPTRLWQPDGKPLAVYLPGVLADTDPSTRDILSSMKTQRTDNRWYASGTVGVPEGPRNGRRPRSRSVASAVIGSIDPKGHKTFCRLTAWTGAHAAEFRGLVPLLGRIAGHLEAEVPDRYRAQQLQAAKANPAWVIPGTPFTTCTVNNTYPTGVHVDKGDLDAGFSTLACFRRDGTDGPYTGGALVFPEFRVGVSMRDGDLLLMDAHQWHGNTMIVCPHGARSEAARECCGVERVSVVAYMRTRIVACGSPADEAAKGREYAAARSGIPDLGVAEAEGNAG